MVRIPSSFEIIGSKEKAVAIVEIPEELKDKEKEKKEIAPSDLWEYGKRSLIKDENTGLHNKSFS